MAVATTGNVYDIFPEGGWDVHHHVFDPSKFPYSENRHLTLPPATIQQFLAFKQTIGITHSVLIHGLSYDTDCTSLVSFLLELGNTKTKGIGVIDPDNTTDDQISQMHAAGVRGRRVNLYKYSAMHDLSRQKVALREHARSIRRFPEWTMAFTHTHPEFWRELRPIIESEVASRGIILVTDHFALLIETSMLPLEYSGDVISMVRDGLL